MRAEYVLDSQEAPALCGIDEVGRGPLAGPVMAACVFIPDDKRALPFWQNITDSKKLSAKKRESLFELILDNSVYGIAEASAEEIDALNIHRATLLAMQRAFVKAEIEPDMALVDGKFCPDITCPAEAVIKGDSKHLEIAAASIIAKVTRDRLMARLHDDHPHYGWDRNAGYGTAEHRAGIEAHGITVHHRKSFAPCALYVS